LKEFWERYKRNKGAVIGLYVVVFVVLVAILAPILFSASPWELAGRPFLPPMSPKFLLGTDMLGRDILAGLAHGARVSLIVGIASALASTTIGILVGGIAGYYGGRIDDALMRFTELFQTIPSFILAIVLVAILNPTIYSVVLAIAIISWPPIARLVRGEFLSLREREFVMASIVIGQSDMRIIFTQILPNAMGPIIVMASLGFGDPEMMSWGFMIGSSRNLIRVAWWMSLFPGLAIFVTVLALNLVGEGLTDALNPRLAREVKA
jgi:peptide/nickel transport system permease protein